MSRQVVSFTLAGQLFGLPVEQVRDALSGERLSPIPLAPDDIAGALNLRGRIVTAIDLGRRLGLAGPSPGAAVKGLVVAQDRALYGLIVETLGEVLTLPAAARDHPPAEPAGPPGRLCRRPLPARGWAAGAARRRAAAGPLPRRPPGGGGLKPACNDRGILELCHEVLSDRR